MVEQNTIACKHVVSFAVVEDYPIGIQFGNALTINMLNHHKD